MAMGTLRLKGEPYKKKKKKEIVFKPYSKEIKPKIKYSKNRQAIHDIAFKAKQMGISYGEYVARYGDGV
jgi:hypothetical protein